ncbi:hypothetical protein GLOTRDRAFT_123888 [Gloeophyllum trabeum ATCC 11539]|uniref:Uncharacterized protein n=1 Tax=Gloeophyllum trabeum (strain ATCC 11539 / FP-39264 / Madison 617) TaxID=670483 RepID=S7QK64_GLOTA|nr:uncharacterized protein GLOTRDRAFT_123888 [Gloeophyllum trabeum ATCC 11539]EPQ60131.1 hypothetical protein GLOTRDRAFT_123888 [Gloeophyllum trabeum ATCC 11539]
MEDFRFMLGSLPSLAALVAYKSALFPDSLFEEWDRVEMGAVDEWAKPRSLLLFLSLSGDGLPFYRTVEDVEVIPVGQILCYKDFLLCDHLYMHPAFAVEAAHKWLNMRHFKAWLASEYCSPEIKQNQLFFNYPLSRVWRTMNEERTCPDTWRFETLQWEKYPKVMEAKAGNVGGVHYQDLRTALSRMRMAQKAAGAASI